MEHKEDLRLTLSLTSSDINSSYASIDNLSKDHNIFETSLERSGSRTILQGSDEQEGGGRKKLRLSKQQSSTLEDAFRQHHTLNPREKMALANELGMRPRQVEVWFQNRRARKKLKKTEVDCEMLKRCCECLNQENRRLQKELLELRALKRPQYHQCMQMGRVRAGNATTPPTTLLSICPACERAAAGAEHVGIFGGNLASHRRQISPLS